MKVNLVVTATGPNNGRAIPITGAKFVIGRDPACHLRPASQAISKQHCAIHVRKGQVWVQDFGSTNGTLVNDEAVHGEAQVKDGDSLKIGPLEFRVQIVPTPTPADGTPLPDKLKPLAVGAKPVPIKSAAGVDADTDDGLVPLPKAGGGDDDAAAMLLGMDDGPGGETDSVPDGSTVMELPAFDAAGRPIAPKEAEKKPPAPESANAAGDLLKKYFRRTSS